MRRSSWTRPASLALVMALSLSACGGDGDAEAEPTTPTSPTSTATETESPEPSAAEEPGTLVEITFSGGSVTPNGERVEVGIDEPVVLSITADVAGELHVHSTPEQEVAFDEGTSEHTLTFDRPGVVEVEAHDPALVVLQLEVR